MDNAYLTLEQNTCAARIFLNIFGLTLGDISNANESSRIKIFDNQANEVGELYFDSGKIIMYANYNNCSLNASLEMPTIWGFVDLESNNAKFGEWNSNIDFQVQSPSISNIEGNMLISNAIDSEFGINCICHSTINIQANEKDENVVDFYACYTFVIKNLIFFFL